MLVQLTEADGDVLVNVSLPHIRKKLYHALMEARCAYFNKVWGMHIGRGTRISRKAFLDFSNPRGLYIGEYSIVTPGARIFTHDHVNGGFVDTHIGAHCFIGANALLMPGVTVGDQCVVAAGSVVTRDVPPGSMVAGNPARVLRTGIRTGRWGHLIPDTLPTGTPEAPAGR